MNGTASFNEKVQKRPPIINEIIVPIAGPKQDLFAD
jgi:hypothetical protein